MAEQPPDPKVLELFQAMQGKFERRMREMPSREFVAAYADRFVTFIDILGFRELAQSVAKENPNELFHSIADSYWFHSAQHGLTINVISDSVLILSEDSHPSSFISVAHSVNALRNSFLERGFLIRGGIAFGKHFSEYGITISPALIRAYELESTAIYPRIVCDQSVINHVCPNVCTNPKGRQGIVGPYGFHVIRDELPIADFDEKPILEFTPDTLEPYYLRTGHHHDPHYECTEEQVLHIESEGPKLLVRWRSGIMSALDRCTEPKHRKKVSYLIEKWNSYVGSFKLLSKEQKLGLLITAL